MSGVAIAHKGFVMTAAGAERASQQVWQSVLD